MIRHIAGIYGCGRTAGLPGTNRTLFGTQVADGSGLLCRFQICDLFIDPFNPILNVFFLFFQSLNLLFSGHFCQGMTRAAVLVPAPRAKACCWIMAPPPPSRVAKRRKILTGPTLCRAVARTIVRVLLSHTITHFYPPYLAGILPARNYYSDSIKDAK